MEPSLPTHWSSSGDGARAAVFRGAAAPGLAPGGFYTTFAEQAAAGTGASSVQPGAEAPTAASALLDGKPHERGFWAAVKSVVNREKLTFSLWPHFYTAACLAVYGIPSITLRHLAEDPSVKFWIGPYGYYAPIIPVAILMLHALHLKYGRPRLIPVILSAVVPAMVLFAIANEHLLSTNSRAQMLLSKDCRTFPSKGEVHVSWVAANKVFEGCVNRTAAELQRSPDQVRELRRFQDCREWQPDFKIPDPWAEHRRAWSYLKKLEEDHCCSGWCWQAAPIWTYERTRDPCAVSAGAVLKAKVRPVATRMLFYSGIAGVIATLGILRFERKFPEVM